MFLRKIFREIQENDLVQENERVILGLSGGADSVCLLLVLKEWQKIHPFCLEALHLHHHIRGEEADRDLEFVQELCGKEGIFLHVCHEDVPARAKEKKLSLEEAGREARYRLLKEKAGSGKIAVAHHGDDRAETILFHLLRGTGLKGLAVMPSEKDRVIRPLIGVTRKEIEEYLRSRNQNYCQDSTNREMQYTRNRIRHEILPYLQEKGNSRVSEHLLHLGDQAAETQSFLEEMAEQWLRENGNEEGEEIILPGTRLASLPPALGKQVLILSCHRMGEKGISYVHIQELWKICMQEGSFSLNLPGGLLARKEQNFLCMFREKKPEERILPPWKASCFPYEKGQKIPEKRYTKWFDYDKIKGDVSLRYREKGDYFVLRGGGRKTIKTYMIDQKIPVSQRDRIPILAEGSHVLWILGYRISEAYKVTDETRTIYQVTIGGELNE